jgi:hypothetical protein
VIRDSGNCVVGPGGLEPPTRPLLAGLGLEKSPQILMNPKMIDHVCSRLAYAFHWRNVGSASAATPA